MMLKLPPRFLVEQLDTEGIIDDDDKLQRWIEFANEDLAAKMEREDVLSLPLRTVVDRFLLVVDGCLQFGSLEHIYLRSNAVE